MSHPQFRRALLSAFAAALALSCTYDEKPFDETTATETQAIVAGRYIVVLKKGAAARGVAGRSVPDKARSLASRRGGRVVRTYEHALEGFAAELSAAELAAIQADPEVEKVVRDVAVTLDATQANPPSWGLDRVDQHYLPLSQSYTYNDEGEGVHAYVLDTGIYAAHSDFGNGAGGTRIGAGFDFIDDDADPEDCDGHGTHVAGTLGGTTFGVAKRVTIHPVKVTSCNGQGSLSTVLAGVDWIAQNRIFPAVVNASLGFFTHTPDAQVLADAVATSIAAGIPYVVSAGNDNIDACEKIPANVAAAITIGNVDSTDKRSSTSNFGSCVDLFAPGAAITSAGITGTTATAVKSGTSMSAPHAAGVAALYLSANPAATPAQIQQVLVSRATPDLVSFGLPAAVSPNFLLYMGTIPGTSDATPPAVAITAPVNNATLTQVVNTVSATITDAGGAGSTAMFYVNGLPIATDSTAPFGFSWDTTQYANGTYQLQVKGADANGNWGASPAIQVTLNNPQQAAFSSTRGAPFCSVEQPSCKTGSLVVAHGAGVASIGSPGEPNYPNTLGGTCTDGTLGVFHSNPSLDYLSIATTGGGNLAAGQTVTVRADVWATTPADDRFDLFHSANADATPVVWTPVANATNVSFPATGARTFTTSFTLPSGGTRQAIRGQMRVSGSASDCAAGDFNDRDDLVFTVGTSMPASSLKIQYQAGDLNGGDNQIRPQLRLFNLGSSAINLSQVKIRYWYTRENTGQAQSVACDWAQIGCSSLITSFTFLNPVRTNANTYLEVGFTAGTLAAGAQTGPMQLRFNNANWSNYTESNDYSYSLGGTPPTSYIDWTRITIYLNGVLVWGTEP